MRITVIGFFVCACLLVGVCCFAQRPRAEEKTARSPRGAQAGQSGRFIALSFGRGAFGREALAAEGHHQVVLIDSVAESMSVYHVDNATGQLTLKSVRNVHWDMQMEEFNGVRPTPQEIRELVAPR